ncbi:conserved hypothetical protein [Vibrio nigripulchritudo POn4]|uniref:hypothetical protein n=1 Tax=Vibrio nigripulchritudo TaxID=28173 RepID=UPI0003B1F438|nr:hypothetical protein [Vibrio nigripulchritudo]CCN63546.1 conserved hypothetical protein [Vibrio nigripulchritudo POn4]
MMRSKKIGRLMYNLLIEKEMDGFSVTELRDACVSIDDPYINLIDVRKKVYQQILRFVRNNWLRSEGSGQTKRYYQTELFKSYCETRELEKGSKFDYTVLSHERNQYKGELEITLGEIEEYQSLNHRFPELKPKLTPFQEEAKKRSAQLLGKINVLTNAITAISEEG